MPAGSALGALVERMVQVEVEAGSNLRLVADRMDPDVDHRDLFISEVGSFAALWIQVKGTVDPDREGRVVAFAEYDEAAIPESPRLLYAVCQVDMALHQLARVWLIPSADFNRLAYRERRRSRPGRVALQFSCRSAGDPTWDRFEVARLELGARVMASVDALGPTSGIERQQLAALVATA